MSVEIEEEISVSDIGTPTCTAWYGSGSEQNIVECKEKGVWFIEKLPDHMNPICETHYARLKKMIPWLDSISRRIA